MSTSTFLLIGWIVEPMSGEISPMSSLFPPESCTNYYSDVVLLVRPAFDARYSNVVALEALKLEILLRLALLTVLLIACKLLRFLIPSWVCSDGAFAFIAASDDCESCSWELKECATVEDSAPGTLVPYLAFACIKICCFRSMVALLTTCFAKC